MSESNEGKTLDALTRTCEEYHPHLVRAVQLYKKDDMQPIAEEEVLRTRGGCGIATSILSYFLGLSGNRVKIAMTFNLGEDYSPRDHTFPVVANSEEIIVDPNYLRYLSFIQSDMSHLPHTDILIVPYNQLEEKVREFIRLRNLVHENGYDGDSRRFNPFARFFSHKTDDELRNYLMRV